MFVLGILEWLFKVIYVWLSWKKMNLLDIFVCLFYIIGICICIYEGYKDKFNLFISLKLIK